MHFLIPVALFGITFLGSLWILISNETVPGHTPPRSKTLNLLIWFVFLVSVVMLALILEPKI